MFLALYQLKPSPFHRSYNHSSEDAEIYREFLDIATRVIPEIFRLCAAELRTGISTKPNLLGELLSL